jgi:hypothetical protein
LEDWQLATDIVGVAAHTLTVFAKKSVCTSTLTARPNAGPGGLTPRVIKGSIRRFKGAIIVYVKYVWLGDG